MENNNGPENTIMENSDEVKVKKPISKFKIALVIIVLISIIAVIYFTSNTSAENLQATHGQSSLPEDVAEEKEVQKEAIASVNIEVDKNA